MEKLGLNETRLTEQSLDFGRIGQSYSRVVLRAVFPSSETPRHAAGTGVLGTMERNAE